MSDPNIIFWAAIPDGSSLVANARLQDGSSGTFATTGFFLDQEGAQTRIRDLPFEAELRADHTYQLVLETLPVGGAVVDVEVTVEHDGATIRTSDWDPIQGGPGMRGVFARTVRS